jgi:F0F1-type ATP synthase gamma subunit
MQRMPVPMSFRSSPDLGDTPHLEKLIGPVKVQLDAYIKGEIDVLYIAYTRFINTMKQEPVIEQLLPLSGDLVGGDRQTAGTTSTSRMPRRSSTICWSVTSRR